MARTDFITIPIPIIIIIIIVVTITIIIIIIIIVTITIIAMPIIAALLWEKSSTVASFAAPAEPSRCLRSSDVLSHILLKSAHLPWVAHVLEAAPVVGAVVVLHTGRVHRGVPQGRRRGG